jgi:hypothetical protein
MRKHYMLIITPIEGKDAVACKYHTLLDNSYVKRTRRVCNERCQGISSLSKIEPRFPATGCRTPPPPPPPCQPTNPRQCQRSRRQWIARVATCVHARVRTRVSHYQLNISFIKAPLETGYSTLANLRRQLRRLKGPLASTISFVICARG